MPVNVTSVRVGGGVATLVPSRAAKDSDSSQGRAIETPSPRSRVRREMVEAELMCMGCILSGGCVASAEAEGCLSNGRKNLV